MKKIKNIKVKVSILVVNYNNAKFIKKCINSLISQNYPFIEIIFLDDGSTDDSLKKIKLFKNKVKIIKKKQSKLGAGYYDQIQSFKDCLKASNGKIVFLLDSDDYFSKSKVSTVVKIFKEEKLNVVCDLPILKYKKSEKKIYQKKNIFFNNYWQYLPPTSCIAIQKNQFRKIFNLLDSRSFPDVWLDFRLLITSIFVLKKVKIIDLNLTYYRQLENSASSKFSFLSPNWWRRRYQSHMFVENTFKKKNINHIKNYDYFLTQIINFFL